MASTELSRASETVHGRFEAYLGIARAKFLALPVALVALGTATAASAGYFDARRTAIALVGLVCFHVAVNALNEYSDYQSGIDAETEKTPFSGGSGTLPAGHVEPKSALYLGLLALAGGGVVGAYFLSVYGRVLLPVVLVAVVSVVGYTDYFTRVGLGEVAAGLGLGFVPVVGTALVQGGTIPVASYAAGVPAFFLTFDLLLLNEFPDQEADREGGRRNLLHLLGRRNAARLYVLAGLAVPGSIVGLVATGVFPPLALVGVLPSIFLARPTKWAIAHPTTAVDVDALRDNVIWVLFTNFLLAAGVAFPAEAVATASGMPVNDGVFLLARLLFGLVLALMAFNNLADLGTVATKIGEAGVPYPRGATILASVPLLFSAFSIALGVYPVVGAAYLVCFLAVTTVTVHNFLGIDDPAEQDNEIFHFLKNLLILAAALLFLSLALGGADWSYGLGRGLVSALPIVAIRSDATGRTVAAARRDADRLLPKQGQ